VPQHTVTQALLAEFGEPLLSSTLLLPGEDEPMTQGWEIKERLDHLLDAVIDAGDCGTEPATVIDLSGPEPESCVAGPETPRASSSRTANSRVRPHAHRRPYHHVGAAMNEGTRDVRMIL
jgi:tRNA A37 threonylcarbamoyladenosine synthetase subunit TsaC/SUA5/YrdC